MIKKLLLFNLAILMAKSVFAGVSILPNANGVLFVNKSASGGSGNSWANAIKELADALVEARTNTAIKEIWVAKGVYKPLYYTGITGTNLTNRDNAFVLVKDVKVYGGFAGTEVSLAARDLGITANATTLSGDVNGNDGANFSNNAENIHHVVISAGNLGTAELNGFTVSGGNANSTSTAYRTVNSMSVRRSYAGGLYNISSSPILKNLIFNTNSSFSYGGAIFNDGGALTITNVIVNGNKGGDGGGMYNDEASPVLMNVTFSNNTGDNGGGMYNSNSSPILISVRVTGNRALVSGGGLNFNGGTGVLTNVTISGNVGQGSIEGVGGILNRGSLTVNNSIIWGNTSINGSNGNVINYIDEFGDPESPQATIAYHFSLVQGSSQGWNDLGTDGGHNKDADPMFIDVANGDYMLKIGSPAINAGSNALFAGLDATTLDLGGDVRAYNFLGGGVIDMGAYEYQEPGTLPVSLINFTAKAEIAGARLNWKTADEQNNQFFTISRSTDGIGFKEIGTVKSKGDSKQEVNYTFFDPLPVWGVNYYRLQQTDTDGKEVVLGIRPVTVKLNVAEVIIYPNPTKDVVNVKFLAGIFNQIELIDLNGKILSSEQLNAAMVNVSLRLLNYPQGNYMLRLVGSDQTTICRLIKL